MHAVVIYDSKFGNTEKIAQAIARGLSAHGDVRVMSTGEATPTERPDLLLLGGPTQKRGASPGLRDFMEALPAALRGVPAAVFDTRYRGATWLFGSAAAEAAKAIRAAGGDVVAEPESFFIVRKGPMERQTLEPRETERAEQWAAALAAADDGRRQS
ncbi:MAG TPA: flavodoxin domain-containing protein [Gaiellaceae bacterium]|nr:flavodoxin domain-containing protein [Gaiellaceae bacterium]